ncbi:helix-turn-helix domain-containing protein [Halococcus hamelinensis]|uniref:Bacterio-opsin activator HTH domain-containing protein n=1 Tax=Halococcus hamelinensis 100A6 TaxID=1132509 RepID=M0MA18_9EURY|nr:helix-turn-helix domain-containing protein [Halococcus hamelinensis]EMA41469.1 bacterio-opsin activator HTH domain-containing protein [Halococcus hamelinensis 100A6]
MNASGSALRVTLDVWHPNCWTIRTTERVDVGFLAYGVYSRVDGRATTHVTVYGDTRATIERALDVVDGFESVYRMSGMKGGYDRRPAVTPPGNASRDLLVEHDGETQISEAFFARGFAHAERTDIHDGSERWTLLSNDDRETIQDHFAAIRKEEGAEIAVQGIERATNPSNGGAEPLPLGRLSHRQREVFRLARDRGYYRWPTETPAEELADELGITTSTLHEHLYKAEQKLLDRSEPDDAEP